MPFVFKVSVFLLLAALLAGQAWQLTAAAPGAEAASAAYRAECPAIADHAPIVTKGDSVRFYDAYAIASLGDLTGLYTGCRR